MSAIYRPLIDADLSDSLPHGTAKTNVGNYILSSGLLASVLDGILTVSGAAAAGGGIQTVRIEVTEQGNATVQDASINPVEDIPVSSDGTPITSVALDGITNAGVFFRSLLPSLTSVLGTAFDDFIVLGTSSGYYMTKGGAGDDQFVVFDEGKVSGQRGDDIIRVNGGSGRLVGGAGDDELLGGRAEDYLKGGIGDDDLDGRDNFDVARYSGARADYQIELVDGRYIVSDLRQNSPDGQDTLVNVEAFRFSDGLVPIEGAMQSFASSPEFWI